MFFIHNEITYQIKTGLMNLLSAYEDFWMEALIPEVFIPVHRTKKKMPRLHSEETKVLDRDGYTQAAL